MSTTTTDLQIQLLNVFSSVFGRTIDGPRVSVNDLEEWDSLSHIKLMIELEQQFSIQIDPEAIASLYSDTDTILAYLETRIETGEC
jgi:acyl carrier protein